MTHAIDRRLHEAKGRKLRLHAARNRLKSVKSDHRAVTKRRDRLQKRLRKERRDVKRLQGMGLASFYHSLMGTKDRRLRKERQEVSEAQLKLEAAREEVDALELEIEGLRAEIESLGDPGRDYEEALKEKARAVSAAGGARARELATLAGRRADQEEAIRELKEAVSAAKAASAALNLVLTHLDNAANWGSYDMMGGGWMSTSFKHDHLDKASRATRSAQIALRRLKRELSDVGTSARLQIRLDEFSKFADFFFDGFFVDWMVQSKIRHSRDRVVRTRGKIASIRSRLADRLRDRREKLDEIRARRRAILEKP